MLSYVREYSPVCVDCMSRRDHVAIHVYRLNIYFAGQLRTGTRAVKFGYPRQAFELFALPSFFPLCALKVHLPKHKNLENSPCIPLTSLTSVDRRVGQTHPTWNYFLLFRSSQAAVNSVGFIPIVRIPVCKYACFFIVVVHYLWLM